MIHLGIAFDSNYLPPFYALVSSIAANNKSQSITIHAIATGVPQSELDKIAAFLEQHGKQIVYYEIDESKLQNIVLNDSWTHAVYYRLLFPFLVPAEIGRLIYLDTDMLVLGDLACLYHQELNNYPVGAVYDNYVKKNAAIGIEEDGEYFNSGMLLIDLESWKEQQISEKAFEYLENYPERISFVDQDALNAILRKNWQKLPVGFNLLYSYLPTESSEKQLREFLSDVVVVHFTLQRPWEIQCSNRLRSLYYYYLKLIGKKDTRRYAGLSMGGAREFVRVRAVEFYWDHPAARAIWKFLRGLPGLFRADKKTTACIDTKL